MTAQYFLFYDFCSKTFGYLNNRERLKNVLQRTLFLEVLLRQMTFMP